MRWNPDDTDPFDRQTANWTPEKNSVPSTLISETRIARCHKVDIRINYVVGIR